MCAGQPLSIDKVRDGAFAELATSILACVARLHDGGVIHLDMKPQNFVVLGGEARLIDFESAVVLPADETRVSLDNMYCTAGFVAPELDIGEWPQLVGAAADAFALGRSLDCALQARDESSYEHRDALRTMIRGLCDKDEPARWTVARALEHWRVAVSD